jgi:hypothetical protein
MANGNGAAVRSAEPDQDEEENIFVFYSNLIGMSLLQAVHPPANQAQATLASSSP